MLDSISCVLEKFQGVCVMILAFPWSTPWDWWGTLEVDAHMPEMATGDQPSRASQDMRLAVPDPGECLVNQDELVTLEDKRSEERR